MSTNFDSNHEGEQSPTATIAGSAPTAANPMAEVTAMSTIAEALSPLQPAGVRRVLAWAADHFGVPDVAPSPAHEQQNRGSTGLSARSRPTVQQQGRDGRLEDADEPEFETMADLFSMADLRNDPERALFGAYWLQEIGGQPDFDSASLNRELKHLGHAASNITSALTSLMTKRPQLVVQTRKSGASRQARKKYKLTSAGVQKVKAMLRGEGA